MQLRGDALSTQPNGIGHRYKLILGIMPHFAALCHGSEAILHGLLRPQEAMLRILNYLWTDMDAKGVITPGTIIQLRVMLHKKLIDIGCTLDSLSHHRSPTSPGVEEEVQALLTDWRSYHSLLLRVARVELEDGIFMIMKYAEVSELLRAETRAFAAQDFRRQHLVHMLGGLPKDQLRPRAEVKQMLMFGHVKYPIPKVLILLVGYLRHRQFTRPLSKLVAKRQAYSRNPAGFWAGMLRPTTRIHRELSVS